MLDNIHMVSLTGEQSIRNVCYYYKCISLCYRIDRNLEEDDTATTSKDDKDLIGFYHPYELLYKQK